jgi:hypothetical protein
MQASPSEIITLFADSLDELHAYEHGLFEIALCQLLRVGEIVDNASEMLQTSSSLILYHLTFHFNTRVVLASVAVGFIVLLNIRKK